MHCTVLFRLKHCFYLGQYVIIVENTITTETISLEIILILSAVRLREIILDPADLK